MFDACQFGPLKNGIMSDKSLVFDDTLNAVSVNRKIYFIPKYTSQIAITFNFRNKSEFVSIQTA